MCVNCGFPISKLKALNVAILLKDPQMVSDLIQMGVDVNGIDENGQSPLMIAESSGNAQIVKILQDAGANRISVDSAPEVPLEEIPFEDPKTEPMLITFVEEAIIAFEKQKEIPTLQPEPTPGPEEVQTEPSVPAPQEVQPEQSKQQSKQKQEVIPVAAQEKPTKPKTRKRKIVAVPQEPDDVSEQERLARQEADAMALEQLSLQKNADGLNCLQCGGSIKPDDISCNHCKTLIIRRYCSHCSQLIPDHAATCPRCGKNVQEHFLYAKLKRAKLFIGTMTLTLISTLLMILVLQQPDTQQSSAYQAAQKTAESQIETNLPETTEPVVEMSTSPEPTLKQVTPAPTKPKIEARSTTKGIYKETTVADPEPIEQIEPPIVEEQNLNPPMSASTQRVLELNDKQRIRRGRYLNSKGFSLIKEGRPSEAIPLLEQAIRSFPQGTEDVTYAYALFNLGVAYRMAGRPDIAIPILEERIKIDNQREVVQRELTVARRQAHRSSLSKNRYN
jgi:hypothetical protein